MANILVVDDASFMRGSLKYIVENGGHKVVGMAKDGEEALKMFRQFKPDIVTLDILMKGMDGITALKKIKELDPKAKVIMVSALGTEEKKEESASLGAQGYIRKPFKQVEIMAELEKVIKIH
jgi:two-component system chemotaxis response regulator CheY